MRRPGLSRRSGLVGTFLLLASLAAMPSAQSLEAAGHQPRAPLAPLNYTTTWLGNSIADGTDHVPHGFDDIAVTPDGTIFSNVEWEEGGYEVSEFSAAGALRGNAGHTHGWGMAGGKAVAANARYVFFTQSVGNEGGGLVDASTWPPDGKEWFGLSRRARADISKAVPFPGAKGGAGDTLRGGFLAIHEVRRGDASLTGLAANSRRLFVSDPHSRRVLVYSPESMNRIATWRGLPRLGQLALDRDGNLWALQEAGSGQRPRVLGLRPDGSRFAAVVLPKRSVPVDVAVDRSGRLWVADNGRDQNLKVYDTTALSGRPTRISSTLGSSLVAGPRPLRGVVGGSRFLGLTGVGADAKGNVFVSSSYGGPHGILESFTPQGELRWARHGLPFVDMAAIDPGAEGDIYSADLRYSFDWSKSEPGSEWSLSGVTMDPIRHPNDLRRRGAQPILRRLNDGALYMFTSDMYASNITAFRFDRERNGETAIKAAFIDKRDRMGRDLDGDGEIRGPEISVRPDAVDHGDATWGFWVDDRGDVWQTINADDADDAELRRYRLQGFDGRGAPVYDFDATDSYEIPVPFTNSLNEGLERVVYDSESDTMYLAGYTAQAPSDTWGSFRVVARYDNWSEGNRVASWVEELPYDTSSGRVPIALAVAGDYFFIGGVTSRAEISVYSAGDATKVGTLTPNNGFFTVEETGWIDVRPFGISATERSNGEYAVLVEDDGFIKTVMYRWRP